MSYSKHNFIDGQTFEASHANAMEDGIVQNETDIGNLKTGTNELKVIVDQLGVDFDVAQRDIERLNKEALGVVRLGELNWVMQYTLLNTDGEPAPANTYAYTDEYIPVSDTEKVYVYDGTTKDENGVSYACRVHQYDANKQWLGYLNFNLSTGGVPVTVASGCAYVRIVFGRLDSTSITIKQADMFAFSVYTKGVNPIDDMKQRIEKIEPQMTIETDLSKVNIGVGYGGLTMNTSPNPNTNTNRIRLLFDGGGAIFAGAGSVLTIDAGFKFNVFLYTEYRSSADSVFDRLINMSGDAKTIDEPRYIRVSIGAESNEVLWREVDGVKTLTELGERAFNAIHLNIVGDTLKDAVMKLQESVAASSGAVEMTNPELPIDAVSYHATWNPLVESGSVIRSNPTYMDWDTEQKYPMYVYRVAQHKDWINQEYNISNYDGNPDHGLYKRNKVLITSGMHGNERGTPNYLREWVAHMLASREGADYLAANDFWLIPLVNPWGYSHSLLDSSGNVVYGSPQYNDVPIGHPSDYTIIENTAGTNAGMRRNKDGYDINRDFSDNVYTYQNRNYGFVTDEARYVQGLFANDGLKFDCVVDMHQAPSRGEKGSRICGFTSISSKPSTMDDAEYADLKGAVFAAITEGGVQTDISMSAYVGMEHTEQTSFPWDGTDSATFRNYAGGFSKYGTGNTLYTENTSGFALCLEASNRCGYYSGTNVYNSKIANVFGNTYVHNELPRILDVLKESSMHVTYDGYGNVNIGGL